MAIGFLIAGCAAFIWSLGRVDVDRVGDLGLVELAPALYWAAVACVSVAFAISCCATRPRQLVLGASLLAILVMLYGLATFTEPLARFQTAWLHAGFIEYIGRTGKVLPTLDARYSWPGAFAFGAWADGAAGASSAIGLLRFAPLAFALLYLAPVWSIAAGLTADVRSRWLTLWIFTIANWVGQEYLSPQALGFLLYLVIVAVLVRWFRPSNDVTAEVPPPADDPRPKLPVRWWRRLLRVLREPDELPPSAAPTATLAVGVILVLFLFAASVVAHQLTPLFALAFMVVMAIVGRLRLRVLPVACALLLLGWLSWGAIGFWSGHLEFLIGGVGNAGANVQANVGQRFVGASQERELILLARVGMTFAIVLLAAWGVWRRVRAGYWDVTALIGAAVPWTVLFGQAYGGEAILRAYLFAAPFLAFLGAAGIATVLNAHGFSSLQERAGKWSRAKTVFGTAALFTVIAVGSMTAAAASVAIRYGNERFERVSESSLASTRWLYANAYFGDTLISAAPSVPWRYRDVERYNYESLLDSKSVRQLGPVETLAERAAAQGSDTYVVLTAEQEAYGELLDGLPKGWLDRYARLLASSGDFVLRYDRDGDRIYQFIRRSR